MSDADPFEDVIPTVEDIAELDPEGPGKVARVLAIEFVDLRTRVEVCESLNGDAVPEPDPEEGDDERGGVFVKRPGVGFARRAGLGLITEAAMQSMEHDFNEVVEQRDNAREQVQDLRRRMREMEARLAPSGFAHTASRDPDYLLARIATIQRANSSLERERDDARRESGRDKDALAKAVDSYHGMHMRAGRAELAVRQAYGSLDTARIATISGTGPVQTLVHQAWTTLRERVQQMNEEAAEEGECEGWGD